MTISQLRDKLNAAEARREPIVAKLLDLTEKENRTAAEEREYDDLLRSAEKLNNEVARLSSQWRDLVVDSASRPGARESGDGAPQYMRQTSTDVDVFRSTPAELRDAARALLEREHKTQKVMITDDNAAHLDASFGQQSFDRDGNVQFDGARLARRMLITESDAYRSAFQKALASHQPAWTPEEARAINEYRVAEQSLTDESGGFGAPLTIDSTILLTSGGATAPLLDVARVEMIHTKQWNGIASAGVAFAAEAESDEIAAQQATISQPTVVPEKAAAYIPFTFEIQGDYPNFANEMQRLIETAYIDYVGEQTAVGAAGVVGIFTALDAASGSEVNPTTDGALGPEDALVVWNALPERARTRAVWLMNVTVESNLRTGADGYGSRNLSSEGIGPLLGKRVLLSDFCPSFTGTTGASNLACLFDPKSYLIAQRVGMNIELVPHGFTSNGLPDGTRGWLAWARIGADMLVDEDGVLLQNA